MSQTGTIYVYPLPAEVEVAPDDETIVEYGFSADVVADETQSVFVEELQASTSYSLYISGRSEDGVVSSPSRLVRVVTTQARMVLRGV